MIRFFIDYSLCSLDSVELAVVEDELSVEEPSVDEAVVELLVEDLVSSVSASKSLERASQYFLYSPSSSESFFSRCSPESFSLSRVAFDLFGLFPSTL